MSGHIFVTGASGRIAASLIPALITEGHRVVGIARTEAKADRVRAMGAACEVGDLSRTDAIDRALDGAHTLYHLAGGMRGRGTETPDRINRLGTLSLLDRVIARSQLSAFVATSTCAVHGDRSGLWVDEEMEAHPNTRYGRSKMAAEEAIFEAMTSHGLPARVVRLAAVYGPGFPFMLEKPIRQGRAWLPGEGRNIVPTIHIDDAVRGLMKVATSSASHSLYNLADPNPVSLAEFYRAVAQSTGGSPPKFWSTWIPSYVQLSAARWAERLQSHTPTTPRLTPDAIRLFTASVRLNVDRIASDLDMHWQYPSALDGVRETLRVV